MSISRQKLRMVLFGLIAICLLFSSCQEKRLVPTFISEDASVVVSINTQHVMESLFEDSLSRRLLYNILSTQNNKISDTQQYGASTLLYGATDETGVSFSDHAYYVVKDAGESTQFTGLFLQLENERNFEEFMLKNPFGWNINKVISKAGFKVGVIPAKDVIVAWNKDLAILSGFAERKQKIVALRNLKEAFRMEVGASIASNPNFLASDLADDEDASMFINLQKIGLLSHQPKDWLYHFPEDDEYIEASMVFNRHNLKIELEHFIEDSADSYYHRLLSETVPSDFTEVVEQDELLCYFNIRYSKELFPKLAQAKKLRMTLKAISLATGLSVDELYELAHGDVFFACSDISEDSTLIQETNKDLAFFADMSTGPNTSSTLIKMKQNGLLNESDTGIFNLAEVVGFDTYLKLDDERLLIAHDSTCFVGVPQFPIRSKEGTFSPITEMLEAYPLSGYVNFGKIREQVVLFDLGPFEAKELEKAVSLLEEARFYTDYPKGKVIRSTMSIDFNKSEESGIMATLKLISVLKGHSTMDGSTAMNP